MTTLISSGWAPFKELLNVIENVVIRKQSDLYTEIDEVLNKHKLAFINILKNQERNTAQLEELKKAPKDGLNLTSGSVRLTDKHVEKIILFSEGLQLNEFACVELFLAADAQEANFPGLSSQCIASLLYHDGRKSLLSALKLLLTARTGVTWTLDLDDRINELVEKFVAELMENRLVTNLLQLLQSISLPEEIQKLEKAKAITDGKHKKLISETIIEQQILIADCLFAISSQQPFSKDNSIKVINYLKSIAPNTSDGSLDKVSLRVLLSLLAAFNCDILDSVIADLEDESYLNLPYFKEKTFFTELHQVIIRPDVQVWETPAIKHIIQFCWSVFLRTCGSHPELCNNESEVLEEDEGTLDEAIDNNVFKLITTAILTYQPLYEEEYFLKLIHSFVTSFIVKFPLKVKELRNRGDDNARVIQAHLAENMEPPQGLRQDFQDLMNMIARLYKDDPLGLELNKDFWLPLEPLGNTFMPQPKKKLQQAYDQKKVMLNKFIRLAGDILLQPLYVPYINMLTSLSNNQEAASFCFRLLASNGSVDHLGSCSVTWDHFFSSLKQYYISLSQDAVMPDGRHHHIHSHQKISPEELEGLEATLNLIKTVAFHNENVRIAFCENQNWLPVASLLGLVSCAVPPRLKGVLLQGLGAFALTPEIASSIWISLEASQVLQTNKLQANEKKSGIAVELEEIEARNETYPETLGFLYLIDKLTESVIPSTLGAGSRVPGFGPYLQFLYSDVYMKFRSRAYQSLNEKWEVGIAALKIIVKILSDYDVQGEDFVDQDIDIQGVKFGKADKPSGFQLLTLLYNDTPFLSTTLSIINECQETLSTMLFDDKRKTALENLAELCLSMLSIALEKQFEFMDAARIYCPSILLSQLDDLLLSINPRSSSPDYLLMLAKFVTINNLKLAVVHHVVKIFKHVCKHMPSQREVISIFCQNETTAREILVGFAERLEIMDAEQTIEEDINDNYIKVEAIEDVIRQDIVEILMTSTEAMSPNVGQFMLGFDVRQSIMKTNLQDAGVAGFPKTCLHSAIEILNRNLSSMGRVKCLTPKLTDLLYHLIYLLYCHDEMGPPIRRYLRTSTDYLKLHCQVLPFTSSANEQTVDEIEYIKLANQQAWLLKTLAVELKVLASRAVRSNLEHLINVLFEEKESTAHAHSTSQIKSASMFEISRRDTFSKTMHSVPFTSEPSRNVILCLLNSLSFEQRYPPNVEFQYFDYSAVEQLINSCEEISHGGIQLCNIKKLFRVVMTEVNNSQLATGVGQRQDIMKDMHALLKHAVDRNLVRESFHAKRNAIEAWGEVIEVLFCSCSSEVLPDALKQTTIIDVLQQLLAKIRRIPPSTNSPLNPPLQTFLQRFRETVIDEENLHELTSQLTAIILTLFASLSFSVKQTSMARNKIVSLNQLLSTMITLLPNLIEAIIKSSSSSARVRSNLYAAFLYYIRIVNMNDDNEKKGVGNSLFAEVESLSSIQTSSYEILNKYGEAFMDILAKDVCQGPCINRMMALSVSDMIASFDWKERYLVYLTSHGYLRVLIDQLTSDDEELQNILLPRSQSMKPLYLYQSKMSFLCKLATSEYGVQALLQNGLLTKLAECQFLDMCIGKVPLDYNSSQRISPSIDPFMPDIIERSALLFSVTAKLVLAFLSSVGLRHCAVVSQVQSLLLCHEELFLSVLQNQSRVLNESSLEQVSLTIAMLSMLPVNESGLDSWEILSDEQRHWKLFMNRVRRHMPILLQRYSTSSSKKRMEEMLKRDDYPRTVFKLSPINCQYVQLQLAFIRIRSRILTFFKNVVSQTKGSSLPRIICVPSFENTNILETSVLSAAGKGAEKRLPSMSIFLQELMDAPSQLKHCLENKANVERKLNNLSDMSHEEMREILAQEAESEKLPYDKKAQVVHRILTRLLELRTEEANCISYNVELLMYLLWHHIDFYYTKYAPIQDDSFDMSNMFKSTRPRRLTETTLVGSERSPSKLNNNRNINDKSFVEGVTEDHIRQFKEDAPHVLNETFWRKLKDMDKMYNDTRTRFSFMSALIRRTQGLIKLNS